MQLKKAAIAMGLVFLALLCAVVIASKVSTPEFHSGTIQAIEKNIGTVMKLTGASTAASAAISLMPGDIATPIAEKLADFSTYFLIVLCVLYVEKFFVIVAGYITFCVCFPGAFLCLAADQFAKFDLLKIWAAKLILVGGLVFTLVPASVKLSNFIYTIYQPSIDQTINSAVNITKDIREAVEEQNEEPEDKNFLEKAFDKVTKGATVATDTIQKMISKYVEVLAVMIVISCVIPVVVCLIFLKVIKAIFGWHLPGIYGRRWMQKS